MGTWIRVHRGWYHLLSSCVQSRRRQRQSTPRGWRSSSGSSATVWCAQHSQDCELVFCSALDRPNRCAVHWNSTSWASAADRGRQVSGYIAMPASHIGACMLHRDTVIAHARDSGDTRRRERHGALPAQQPAVLHAVPRRLPVWTNCLVVKIGTQKPSGQDRCSSELGKLGPRRWTWMCCGRRRGAGAPRRCAPTAGACCWATCRPPATAGAALLPCTRLFTVQPTYLQSGAWLCGCLADRLDAAGAAFCRGPV
jgi:hypothetical protein